MVGIENKYTVLITNYIDNIFFEIEIDKKLNLIASRFRFLSGFQNFFKMIFTAFYHIYLYLLFTVIFIRTVFQNNHKPNFSSAVQVDDTDIN